LDNWKISDDLFALGAALGMKVEDVFTQNRRLWGAAAREGRQGARHAMPPQP
jgi:hypothetical protein